MYIEKNIHQFDPNYQWYFQSLYSTQTSYLIDLKAKIEGNHDATLLDDVGQIDLPLDPHLEDHSNFGQSFHFDISFQIQIVYYETL